MASPLAPCCCFCGFFMLGLFAIIHFGLTNLAEMSNSYLQQERDDLMTAWDSTCTLSLNPGNPRPKQYEYICGKNCRETVLRKECIATLQFAATSFHQGGTTEVSVLAAMDFKLDGSGQADLCKKTLTGVWPNVQVSGKTRTVSGVTSGELETSSAWACGDLGWVGCKSGSFFGGSMECFHHFGERADIGDADYSSISSVTSVYGALFQAAVICPSSLKNGSNYTCSIDNTRHVRFGGTQDLVRQIEADLQQTEVASNTTTVLSWVVFIAAISCCLTSCLVAGVCKEIANQLDHMLTSRLPMVRNNFDISGNMVGASTDMVTGVTSNAREPCLTCGGVGKRGLLGPKGLGVLTFSCAKCNGLGHMPLRQPVV